jgi:hypothetical protein
MCQRFLRRDRWEAIPKSEDDPYPDPIWFNAHVIPKESVEEKTARHMREMEEKPPWMRR